MRQQRVQAQIPQNREEEHPEGFGVGLPQEAPRSFPTHGVGRLARGEEKAELYLCLYVFGGL